MLASDYDDDPTLSSGKFPGPTRTVSYFRVEVQRATVTPNTNVTTNTTSPFIYAFPPSSTTATHYSTPWISTETCSNALNYLNDTNGVGELEPQTALWACTLCPKRAACPGGDANVWHNVKAKFGAYRENQANRGASNFSGCLAPAMCLGKPNLELRNRFLDAESGEDLALKVHPNITEGCNESRGAFGPLCGQCRPGFYRATHTFECTKCGDIGLVLGLIMLALTILVAVLIGVVIFTVKNEATDSAVDLQMVKIMVNHLAISSGTSKLPLRWAPWLERLFELFEVFSITLGDDGTPLSLACVSRSHPWLDATMLLAATPVIVVTLTLVLLRPNNRCVRWWRVRHNIDSKSVAKVTMMVFLLLIHSSLTRQGIKFFACRDVGKRSSPNHIMVLDMDFGYQCDDPFITTLRWALGMPMLLLYGLGIPVFYFTRLWRHRDNLDYLKDVYGFLLAGFRDERYYWELWNTLRKAIFAVVSIVFAPMGVRMHLWAMLGVLQLFCSMEYWGHPHSMPFLNKLEDLALTSDVWQVIFGLGLVSSCEESPRDLCCCFFFVFFAHLRSFFFLVFFFFFFPFFFYSVLCDGRWIFPGRRSVQSGYFYSERSIHYILGLHVVAE